MTSKTATPPEGGALPVEDFTAAERAVLKHAAEHYLTGRRLACFAFRACVAIGALAGAVVAILAALRDGAPAVSHVFHG
ncbi:MAG: hypothetical protein WDN25_04050 [Acetobacteraceae bacterium]